jgi:hypothetical protein
MRFNQWLMWGLGIAKAIAQSTIPTSRFLVFGNKIHTRLSIYGNFYVDNASNFSEFHLFSIKIYNYPACPLQIKSCFALEGIETN